MGQDKLDWVIRVVGQVWWLSWVSAWNENKAKCNPTSSGASLAIIADTFKLVNKALASALFRQLV